MLMGQCSTMRPSPSDEIETLKAKFPDLLRVVVFNPLMEDR